MPLAVGHLIRSSRSLMGSSNRVRIVGGSGLVSGARDPSWGVRTGRPGRCVRVVLLLAIPHGEFERGARRSRWRAGDTGRLAIPHGEFERGFGSTAPCRRDRSRSLMGSSNVCAIDPSPTCASSRDPSWGVRTAACDHRAMRSTPYLAIPHGEFEPRASASAASVIALAIPHGEFEHARRALEPAVSG